MSAQKKESDILIRLMRNDEKKEIRRVMRRSFPLVQQWFFTLTPDVLVAVKNEKVLGAIVLKPLPLPRKRKGGLMYWGFTDPEARGLNIGLKLYKAGIDYLEKLGCDEILGCVEGNNTSSNKLLVAHGFSILSPAQQFRRYGLGTFLLWFRIFHYLDVGHFLWVRPGPDKPDSPVLQLWGTIITNSLVLLLTFIWIFSRVKPLYLVVVPFFIILFFGIRFVAMKAAAKLCGLSVRYRAWESGFPLSFVIALAFGGWYPIPGSVYPDSDKWRYRQLKHKLGPIALAGAFSVLLLTCGLSFLFLSLSLPPGWTFLPRFADMVGKPLIIFDILLPFFPFVSFNGRRIWDWNRIVWVALAVATVAVIWFF